MNERMTVPANLQAESSAAINARNLELESIDFLVFKFAPCGSSESFSFESFLERSFSAEDLRSSVLEKTEESFSSSEEAPAPMGGVVAHPAHKTEATKRKKGGNKM